MTPFYNIWDKTHIPEILYKLKIRIQIQKSEKVPMEKLLKDVGSK